MRWSDEAVVLSARRHGESGLLVHVFTPGHGRHAGLVRGGQRPKARVIYQIGNRLLATWSARLAEHLGTLTAELAHGYAAAVIAVPPRLACLAAAAALADAALPEREPHPRAYQGLIALLDALEADEGWASTYVAWEMVVLAELGFGLDLERCAATGLVDGLAYVSPRTGRAVSEAAGAPYRDRLLPLPPFLRVDGAAAGSGPAEVLDGVALTGYFLEQRAFAPHGRGLPAARTRFVDALKQMATISGR
jgi:DNA repair protein RecO (recombination protein O)